MRAHVNGGEVHPLHRRTMFFLMECHHSVGLEPLHPQAKSTLGLDFDLQDINLILSLLPGETPGGSRSQGRSKSSGGFIWSDLSL